jgi:hypothetical protein
MKMKEKFFASSRALAECGPSLHLYLFLGALLVFLAGSQFHWNLEFFFGILFFGKVNLLFSALLMIELGVVLTLLLTDMALAKEPVLRITFNLDGVPITSKSHTHPSHSQTSRLLTSSLSLGIPVPRGTQCM